MTLENKYGATELHCSQKDAVLQGSDWTFLLAYRCVSGIHSHCIPNKRGQMVRVVSNVFITRPHTTNGYLLVSRK